MTSFSNEEISRRLSHTLDCLGYSQQMVQIRKNYYNLLPEISFRKFMMEEDSNLKIMGSRREGLVKFFESDFDVLASDNKVLVVEDHINTEFISESVSVFRMVPCLSHPGHCKLLLIRQGTEDHKAVNALNPFANGYYLCKKKFFESSNDDYETLSGPALTGIELGVSMDGVKTFLCVCPSIIQRWAQRPRRYDWPPSELRQRILYMTGNVVAAGHKKCKDEDIEWRLCFNEIELLLVDTWNDTQRKLYKVLKMIKKDVIVQAGFNITSYIIKNIVLWLSEMYPQAMFKHEYMLSWIFKSLKLLKKAVKIYNLPYYMIPERNLIAEKVPRCQRRDLIKEISALIHCGPQLLWECEKLEFAMSMTPNELLYFKENCDRLEVITMVSTLPVYAEENNTDSSHIEAELEYKMNLIINSQWPAPVKERLKDKDTEKSFMELLS